MKNKIGRDEEGSVSVKQNAENLQKENKFMSEQIKRLAGEKMKVEKKGTEQEKAIKKL